MVRNIAIIIGIAVVAFLAVIGLPRLFNDEGASGGGDRETASSESTDSGQRATGSSSGSDVQASSSGGQRNPRAASPMLASQLAEAARQVNASGPVRIDDITRLNGAEARGNRIRYRYEVSEQMSAAQIEMLERNISSMNQNTICSRPDARQLIELGGEIEYAYYGPRGDLWFTTPIVDC